MRQIAPLALAVVLVGCGGGGDDDSARDVVSELRTIGEGAALSYSLPAATYAIEVTSSNNGVVVSWLGGSGPGCATSAEVKIYQTTCTLSIQGQLVITIPTTFGLGGAENVSIRATRL